MCCCYVFRSSLCLYSFRFLIFVFMSRSISSYENSSARFQMCRPNANDPFFPKIPNIIVKTNHYHSLKWYHKEPNRFFQEIFPMKEFHWIKTVIKITAIANWYLIGKREEAPLIKKNSWYYEATLIGNFIQIIIWPQYENSPNHSFFFFLQKLKTLLW